MNDAVVVGGGPAGAATAAVLATAGRDVLVLERDAGPADKVCGDFLSIEAQRALADLGLDLAPLGASPIGSVRMVRGARRMAEARLPFTALGLSRRSLDAALLDLAAARGATVRRGAKVLGLRPERAGLALALPEGEMQVGAAFLATGKHELRGVPRAARAPKSVGFKTYLTLAPDQSAELRGAVEIVLFDGGYAGLLLVEGDAANLSLIVSAERLARAGGDWETLLAALCAECRHLSGRLRGAVAMLGRPLAISRLPYGFLHAPSAADPPRLYRVGDQAAVIPSLTGDGVSIALHSACRAAHAYLGGRPAAKHHAALRRDLRAQMLRASLIHDACLTRASQPAVVALCRTAPGVMRLAAAWTRIAPAPSRPANGWARRPASDLLGSHG